MQAWQIKSRKKVAGDKRQGVPMGAVITQIRGALSHGACTNGKAMCGRWSKRMIPSRPYPRGTTAQLTILSS